MLASHGLGHHVEVIRLDCVDLIAKMVCLVCWLENQAHLFTVHSEVEALGDCAQQQYADEFV